MNLCSFHSSWVEPLFNLEKGFIECNSIANQLGAVGWTALFLFFTFKIATYLHKVWKPHKKTEGGKSD